MIKIYLIIGASSFVASHIHNDNDFFIIAMFLMVLIAINAARKIGQFKID